MNGNGQRLLELCSYHNFCVMNTFLWNKPHHKVSWRHPRSNHGYQLDLVITRPNSLNSVSNTRAYHSGDHNTDHSLVICRIKLQQKKFYWREKAQSGINISRMAFPDKNHELVEWFAKMLPVEQDKDVEKKWSSIHNTIYKVAVATYGKHE